MKQKTKTVFGMLLLLGVLASCGQRADATSSSGRYISQNQPNSNSSQGNKPSSTSAEQSHALSLVLPEDGYVTGQFRLNNRNATSAREGQTITLTLSFREENNQVTVTSNDVTLNQQNIKTYTFTMPDKDVTITVSNVHTKGNYQIEGIRYATSFASFVSLDHYYLYEDTTEKPVYAGETFEEGSQLTFSFVGMGSWFNNGMGYSLYVNDVAYPMTVTDTAKDTEKKASATITMPEDNATFVLASHLESVPQDDTSIHIHVDDYDHGHIYGVEDDKYYDGVNIELYPLLDPGYGDAVINYTTNNPDVMGTLQMDDIFNSVTLPVSDFDDSITDVTLSLSGMKTGNERRLTLDPTSDVHFVGDPRMTSGKAGDIYLACDDSHVISNVQIYTDSSKNTEFTSFSYDDTHQSLEISEMPDHDLFVVPVLSDMVHLSDYLEPNPLIAFVKFVSFASRGTKEIEYAKPGSNDVAVQATAVAPNIVGAAYYDYTRNGKKYTREMRYANSCNGYMMNSVPKDLTGFRIYFVVGVPHKVTVPQDDKHYTFTDIKDQDEYLVGRDVSFKFTPKPGYLVSSLKATYGDDNTEIELTENNGRYSFKMPDGDVKFSVVGEEKGTVKVNVNKPDGIYSFDIANAYGSLVAGKDGYEVTIGEKVFIRFDSSDIKSGYHISKVTIKGGKDGDIEAVKKDNDTSLVYSFTAMEPLDATLGLTVEPTVEADTAVK